MAYSPILLAHIAGGTAGLLSGTAAIIFRKGSVRHALAGRTFVVAMLTMGSLAAYLAIVRKQPSNFGGGVFTFYLILTAWLTARRRPGETRRYDWLLLLLPLAPGLLTWKNGISIVRSGVDSPDGVPVGMSFFYGFGDAADSCGGRSHVTRWRCSGSEAHRAASLAHVLRTVYRSRLVFYGPSNRPLRLLSAAGLGQHLPPALFSMGVYLILTQLPLILLVYWLIRVRFTNWYAGKLIQAATTSPR